MQVMIWLPKVCKSLLRKRLIHNQLTKFEWSPCQSYWDWKLINLFSVRNSLWILLLSQKGIKHSFVLHVFKKYSNFLTIEQLRNILPDFVINQNMIFRACNVNQTSKDSKWLIHNWLWLSLKHDFSHTMGKV